MKLVRFSLNRPVTVVMLVLSLVVLGAVSLTRLPLEFFPRMDFPFVGVWIPYPNSIPSQIEEEITRPVEEVMATLGGTRNIFSESGSDYSFVGVIFQWGEKVDVHRMEVREKIDAIRDELPDDIDMINVLTFNSSDWPIMVGRISADNTDLSGSYDIIQRKLIAPLERIEGVGQVGIGGVEPRTISIYLHLDRIKALMVDVNLIFQRLQEATLALSVGQIEDGGTRYNLRALSDLERPEDLAEIPIREDGLKLGDVATVSYSEPLLTYGRHLNKEAAVAFWIVKESGANTVSVCRNIHNRLAELKEDPALAGMDILFFLDQSEQIQNSISGLFQAGFIGSLLAVFVLYLFLRRILTTLLVAVAIPFSLISTLAVLYLTGRTLNILTMMGLMLAVGMMVDNAVVVLESITRYQDKEKSAKKAALGGASEVGMAVMAATFTSIIVFAPVTLSSSSSGFLYYLAIVGFTISAALLFSLLVSLILIPLLASRIPPPKQAAEPLWIKWLKGKYVRALSWAALRHPLLTGLVIVPVVFALSIAAAKVGGLEFDIEADEQKDYLFIEYEFTDNMSYRLTEGVVGVVEDSLLAHKDELNIDQVYSFYQDNHAETTIYFNKKSLSTKEIKSVRNDLREILPEMAGVELNLGGGEDSNISGATSVQVSLHGEDHKLLSQFAEEVKRRFRLIPKMYDIRSNDTEGKEELHLRLDPDRAGRFDVNPAFVASILNLTFRGAPLPEFKAEHGEIDMAILLQPEDRKRIESLLELPVNIIDGREITLGSVADLTMGRGPETIRREQQRTSVSVSGTYESDDSEEAMDQARNIMESLNLPTGYGWSFGRSIEEAQEDSNAVMMNILLALICVFLLMAALFQSFVHPGVIITSLPFAWVGVVVILMATGTPMSIMVMIGIVILVGVVVNNGIVLVHHINTLRRQGLSRDEALVKGSEERMRPILMTASTTILGLLPLAVGTVTVGDVMYKGLALAVMGGLGFSTFLTLLVMPTYYVIAERIASHFRTVWAMGRRSPVRIPWLSRFERKVV